MSARTASKERLKRNLSDMVTRAVEEQGMKRDIFAMMSVSFRASLFWGWGQESDGRVEREKEKEKSVQCRDGCIRNHIDSVSYTP
jgi:hypothetical protein